MITEREEQILYGKYIKLHMENDKLKSELQKRKDEIKSLQKHLVTKSRTDKVFEENANLQKVVQTLTSNYNVLTDVCKQEKSISLKLREDCRQISNKYAKLKRKIEELKKKQQMRRMKRKQELLLAEEEARKAAELRKAQELKIAEERKKAEDLEKAEQIRQAYEARMAEEARRAQELKSAEEAKKLETARKLEEMKKMELMKKTEALKKFQYSKGTNQEPSKKLFEKPETKFTVASMEGVETVIPSDLFKMNGILGTDPSKLTTQKNKGVQCWFVERKGHIEILNSMEKIIKSFGLGGTLVLLFLLILLYVF